MLDVYEYRGVTLLYTTWNCCYIGSQPLSIVRYKFIFLSLVNCCIILLFWFANKINSDLQLNLQPRYVIAAISRWIATSGLNFLVPVHNFVYKALVPLLKCKITYFRSAAVLITVTLKWLKIPCETTVSLPSYRKMKRILSGIKLHIIPTGVSSSICMYSFHVNTQTEK